jgi:hypothetical protein
VRGGRLARASQCGFTLPTHRPLLPRVAVSKWNVTLLWNLLYANGQAPTTCNARTYCTRDAVYPDNG